MLLLLFLPVACRQSFLNTQQSLLRTQVRAASSYLSPWLPGQGSESSLGSCNLSQASHFGNIPANLPATAQGSFPAAPSFSLLVSASSRNHIQIKNFAGLSAPSLQPSLLPSRESCRTPNCRTTQSRAPENTRGPAPPPLLIQPLPVLNSANF